jgi:hypothetical protein
MYGSDWYGANPRAWAPAQWNDGAAWAPTTWAAVAAYGGYNADAPVSYNYGVNVNYQDGNVTADGQNLGSAEEYSQQASDLAQAGAEAQPSADEEWLPLGVYALVRNENQHPHLIMQIAINKQGVLRGNYTDEVSGNTLPIQGSVDNTTQRAAWTVGDNTQSVMEAGLNDLTKTETPALIHKNGQTDHWLLVRLQQQSAEAGDSQTAERQP